MPESDTDFIDYYPSEWEERSHSRNHIIWVHEKDEAIFIRFKEDDRDGEYIVEVITGINDRGEEHTVTTINKSSRQQALINVKNLLYAMNGVYGRVTGKDEFNN